MRPIYVTTCFQTCQTSWSIQSALHITTCTPLETRPFGLTLQRWPTQVLWLAYMKTSSVTHEACVAGEPYLWAQARGLLEKISSDQLASGQV
jgi:hypothetical protein